MAYNASYDFSILHHEMVRHGLSPLSDPRPIVDPLVLDRALDTYRKGKRTLQMATAHYLVRFDDAHTADADAIASGRVAQAILTKFAAELDGDANWLHDQQIAWAKAWAENYQKYRRTHGDPNFRASGGLACEYLGAEVLEALVELLHTSGRVQDALLTRVERVRGTGNFHVNDGVGVAVFEFNRLVARTGGTSQKALPRGQVAKHDGSVLGVDVSLHCISP